MTKTVKISLFLFLSVGMTGACAGDKEASKQPKMAVPEPTAVSVITVENREVDRKIEITGTLDPYEEATVSIEAEGRLTAVRADIGDKVGRGAELARVATEEYELKKVQAEAESAAAQADFDRLTELFGKNIASKQQLDEGKRRLDVARAGGLVTGSSGQAVKQAFFDVLGDESFAHRRGDFLLGRRVDLGLSAIEDPGRTIAGVFLFERVGNPFMGLIGNSDSGGTDVDGYLSDGQSVLGIGGEAGPVGLQIAHFGGLDERGHGRGQVVAFPHIVGHQINHALSAFVQNEVVHDGLRCLPPADEGRHYRPDDQGQQDGHHKDFHHGKSVRRAIPAWRWRY